jgi:CubicO group peptidase (beta-lactamase class C family)
MGEQEATYPPSTRWKYSNLALTLAGEIVQAVADRPYADNIQQQILDPLEMASTSVVLPDVIYNTSRLASCTMSTRLGAEINVPPAAAD